MRERGQASVETIALAATALALAIALGVGVVRLAPPFAAALARTLSVVVAPAPPDAPGLDRLERALLTGATGTGLAGPTLLDLRAHLRARLDRTAADTAFSAILRPLVTRALAAGSIASRPGAVRLVDRAAEDAWIRHRLHPGETQRIADTAVGLAGTPGAVYSTISDLGLAADEPADGIDAGFAAGDVVVAVSGGGYRLVVLRRSPGRGLRVVDFVFAGGGPAYVPSAYAVDPSGLHRNAAGAAR